MNSGRSVLSHILDLIHRQTLGKELIFLTNNLETPALTVAMLYKARWRIQLFFRWIKGHLRINHYYGTSPNAVKTRICTTYLMIAIIHKQLKMPGTFHRPL